MKEIMSPGSLHVFQTKQNLINMHGYILYMCVCAQLNVSSLCDQDVSLPNVMGGSAHGGINGSLL